MTASVSLSVAEQLAITIERGGGTMTLVGDNVDLFLPDDMAHLLPDLREHKREIITLLRRLGGRIAHFILVRTSTPPSYNPQRR